MTDTVAIALYVAAGNPEVLWHAEDEATRLYYRMAAQIKAMEMVGLDGLSSEDFVRKMRDEEWR
jgi:hypothetical protein